MVAVYVALGGAVGALGRYGLGGWVQSVAGGPAAAGVLPWGTFVVNVSGSLLIGFALRAFTSFELAPEARAFLTVGLLGAFTTFSTFSLETVALLDDGRWSAALAYSLGSVLLGVFAVVMGGLLANAVFSGSN